VTEPTDPERHGASPAPRGIPLGAVALGLLLILLGLAWLLHTLDVVEVPFDVLFPIALVVVGTVLLAGARRGRHGGLIALGVVLTILSAATAATDLGAGVGERAVRVTGVEPSRDYELGIGELTIDLTSLEPTGSVEMDASVGIGELHVELPVGVAVSVSAESGIGQVAVLGNEDGGFGSQVEFADDGYGSASARLQLDLSVGLGEVSVTR
jgi:hypothetical protein